MGNSNPLGSGGGGGFGGGNMFKNIQSRPAGTSYRNFFGGSGPGNTGAPVPPQPTNTAAVMPRPAQGYTQAAGPAGVNQYAGAIHPANDTQAPYTPGPAGASTGDSIAPYTPNPVGTTQPGMDSYNQNGPPPGTPYVADPPGGILGGDPYANVPGGEDAYWKNAQAPNMPWQVQDGSIGSNQRGYIGKTPKSEIYGRPGALMTPRGPGPMGNARDDGSMGGGNRMNLGPGGQPMGRGTGLSSYDQALADWQNPQSQAQMVQAYGRPFIQQEIARMEQQLAGMSGAAADPNASPFNGQISERAGAQLSQMLAAMKAALANNPG